MKIQTRPARCSVAGTFAAIALTAVSLSACGGPSPSGGSNGGTSVKVCALVPSSRVAAVTDETVAQAIPKQLGSFPGPASFLCAYYLSGGREIQVEVETTDSSGVFAANGRGLNAGGATPTARVPGVGNKAVASANGLAALTDTDNILIIGVPGEAAWDIKLAKILISALG